MNHTNVPQKDRRSNGFALIVALALLVLMAVLAVTFLVMTGQEEESVSQSELNSQARTLAQSGIEIVRDQGVTEEFFEYAGEDWDNDGQPTVISQNNKDEKFNGNGDDKLDTLLVSPKYALRPSLFKHSGDKEDVPDLIPVETSQGTKYRGYSGRQIPTLSDGSDTYTLRIKDNNIKLNVNSLNPNFPTIINRLYQVLEGDRKTPGKEIIQNRPSRVKVTKDGLKGGFQSTGALRNVLSSKQFRVLSPYLATSNHLWVDSSVIKPSPQPKATNDIDSDPTNSKTAFPYNFDYELQPRSPVNVNQTPREVLIALIWGLRARALAVSSVTNDTDARAKYRTVNVGPITRQEAKKIARRIDRYRDEQISISTEGLLSKTTSRTNLTGPFKTWNEFRAFIRQKLVGENVISKKKGHLLMANFHPNTHFGKFNYNRNGQWSWKESIQGKQYTVFLDKTDLQYYTTEFSFTTMGYLEVDSYGRILDANNEIQAEATMKAVMRKYKVAKHTTQNDFLLNSVGNSQGGGQNQQGTRKVTVHPESAPNAGEWNITGENRTGGKFGGQITISQHSDLGIGHTQFTQSVGKLSEEMSSTLPFGHQVHGYKDFSESRGVLSGRNKRLGNQAGQNYPKSDPAEYSDVTADGMLVGSDRNHVIRFPTHDWEGGDQSWKKGHLEFWWKPKQPIHLEDTHELKSVNWYKETIHQYRTKGNRITLFDMWVKSESANVIVPEYLNTKFQPAWIGEKSKQFLWFMPQGGVVEFRDYKLPADVKERKGIEPNTANAAGVYFEFWLQDNTWYFLIRFRSIFRPEENRWISPKHSPMNFAQDDMLGGAILATLPAEGKAKPRMGQWNQIVLNWQPKRAPKMKGYERLLNYQTPDRFIRYPESLGAVPFYHAIPRPPAQRQEDKRVLDGNFWINGQRNKRKIVWGEGNYQKEFLFLSNLGTANYGEQKYVGTMPAGWPPSVYPLEDGTMSWAPTMIGPKRMKNLASVGHIGGKIRERGEMFEGVGDGEEGKKKGSKEQPSDAEKSGEKQEEGEKENGGASGGNGEKTLDDPEPGEKPEPERTEEGGESVAEGEQGGDSSDKLVPYEKGKKDADWWHSFAEGTIDEVYFSSSPDLAKKAVEKRKSRYYHGSTMNPNRSPAYVGRFRRDKARYWANRASQSKTYGRMKRPMFDVNQDRKIEIRKIGFTQFPPRRNWDGTDITGDGKPTPHFQLQIQQPGSNMYMKPNQRNVWLGGFYSPEQLFNRSVTVEAGSDGLSYRLLLENADRKTWERLNITPYLEDVTIFYRPKGMEQIIQRQYVTNP